MGRNRYGVILDAGSSGTRLHIYRWRDSDHARQKASPKELKSLPKIKTKKSWTKKIHPGVSTFGDRPAAVGEEHLKPLLEHALANIPPEQVADTPLFLMATAGVRLLPEMQRNALLSSICTYAKANTDFSLPDCDLHIQAIDGETEGLYGWIAANYLLGGFDSPEDHSHGKGHHTYGFLDMGGASAQIAFAPNSTEAEKHANDLKLLRMRTLDGSPSDYKVFTATWLGFGVNQARHRYLKALETAVGKDVLELPDPCLPNGLTLTLDGDMVSPDEAAAGPEQHLKGQGRFQECLRSTYPLLDKDAPCDDFPCLLHGQHVPAIDFDVNHFIGVSEYWHTTHGVFELSHKGKAYDFTTYQQSVEEFCARDWKSIEKDVQAAKWGKKVDVQTAQETCFKASWLINVLHDGIGIPRIGLEKPTANANSTKEVSETATGFLDPFQAVDKIDGTEVSWTLGKMVLYSAGQVQPRENDLPVGFGTNQVSGIPSDFQFAGSSYSPFKGTDDDDDDDILDDILDKAPKKSTSTFLILFLVFVVIIYLFRRKERRVRFYNKLNSVFRRSRRPGSPRRGGRGYFSGGKFFGRSPSHYERVLEDGEAANEFELQDVDSDDNDHSDSSEGSRVARSSGLATPKMNIVNFNENNYFDTMPTQGVGINMSNELNAMDRSGLVVRTESRERLAPGHSMLGRSRSRAGSPTRKSPLMAAVGEED